jgi:hypothetical protein
LADQTFRPGLWLVGDERVAVYDVRSWCTWRLIGVRQQFQWVLGSDGVRLQPGMVEVLSISLVVYL